MVGLNCPHPVPNPSSRSEPVAAGTMLDIRVLGTLEMHRPDGGAPLAELTQPKRIALLLYLALAEPAGPKSRDALMALLWPDADAESARHSLRNALYGLRQTVGEAAFVTRGEGYVSLDFAAIRCDALKLRRLLAERKWGEAVSVWGGDLRSRLPRIRDTGVRSLAGEPAHESPPLGRRGGLAAGGRAGKGGGL